MRLCQVAIIGYTRWPFLYRPSAPVRYTLSMLYIRRLSHRARAVRNFREMEVGRNSENATFRQFVE
jgi:hypothetical protein